MDWDLETNSEENNNKNKDSKITKALFVLIGITIVMIVIIAMTLLYVNSNTFRIIVDGKQISRYPEDLIVKDNGIQYVSLKGFAQIVGYGYHSGEYKEYSQDPTKAYVDSEKETASFFLNSNKVCKLSTKNIEEDYEVYEVNDNVKEINGKLYASVEAIKIGFNVAINNTEKSMSISTLSSLVEGWSENAKTAGYELSSDFKNQKAILYGYLIAKKSDKGLYGIYDTKYNEIISARYTNIEFIENSKEFIVTTNENKVGIVDSEGKNKINQIYESIKLIDKESQIYLVSYGSKFGVISNNGQYIIHPEYDKIGIDTSEYKNVKNQYILLDSIIPVCKNGNWGAFDKNGKMILTNSYSGFGCTANTTSSGGDSVIEIEEINGIVTKKR